ncbi:MAG: saccharopine dehydrogenase NADP-binding domain-containing protein [Bacteroidota bacterium]|nr:saccharopine dehydrogenase NADP-binding domain-containing protein [Bacteroidota bacterium]
MRKYDLLIWGATSFTGKLVTEYLFNKYGSSKIKWAIAGRNLDKLKKIRSEVADEKIPMFIADSFDEESLLKFIKKTKVVCSTVGPYSLYGTKLVKLCVENNTNYCDITGEAHWIRNLIDQFHEEAKSKKIKIVNSCGFDSIPSDMGVYFIQNEIKKTYKNYANFIKMRVAGIRGGISGGTYGSINNLLKEAYSNKKIFRVLNNPYGLNPKNKMEGMDKKDLRKIIFDKESNSWIYPFIMAGINTKIVRRSHALTNFQYGKDFRYEEAMMSGKGISGLLKAILAVFPLAMIGLNPNSFLKKIVNSYMPKPGEGPGLEKRKNGFYNLRFYVTIDERRKAFAKVVGDNDPGYGSTSKMLAESALCLAFDKLPENYGVVTPSIAMGNQLLERLRNNAGLNFQISI